MLKSICALMLACAVLAGVPPSSLAQEDDRLHVVASFSILADVVHNVAGDAAEVTSLMPLGAGPHGFSPSPQDMVMLAEADMVFVVGANFEEALLESIANVDEDIQTVVASNCVIIQPFGMAHEDEDAAHVEEAHEGEIGEMCREHHAAVEGLAPPLPEDVPVLGMLHEIECGDHAHGSCDAHVWTDPYNAMLWALMARDTLSAQDPDNADTYTTNAEAYIEALADLFDEVEARIDTIPEANRKLVTNHLAFGYYANRFGLEMVGTVIPGASTLAEPSAAEVAALIEGIKASEVPAVFADSTANPSLAEQVAGETGASFHQLYTGSLTGPEGEVSTYLDYMRVNTRIIVEALGG